MKAAFYTLGCKLNQSETESIAAAFRAAGFLTVTSDEEAYLYIINTCTVTTKGEQKARRVIRKILKERPSASIIVTGCYAQLGSEELSMLGGRVSVVPLDRKDILLDLPKHLVSSDHHATVGEILAGLATGCGDFQETTPARRFRFEAVSDGFHTRPALKIQDGCDNRCSYCRVPLARGGSISLEPEEVTRRVRLMEKAGKREVILTGVNISSYRSSGFTLEKLLRRILSETGSIRIRLSSLEPDTIDEALVRVFENSRICPHFHLPVQSGSDSVLAAMRRRYGVPRIRQAVSLLRNTCGDPFLAADVIVGFPGESDEDFGKTAALLSELDFSWLHVFPFSPRPGTPAFAMTGSVPESIAGERAGKLQKLSGRQYIAYMDRQIGREANVLLESVPSGNASAWVHGRSENYLKTSIPAGAVPGAVKGDLIRCRFAAVLENGIEAYPLIG